MRFLQPVLGITRPDQQNRHETTNVSNIVGETEDCQIELTTTQTPKECKQNNAAGTGILQTTGMKTKRLEMPEEKMERRTAPGGFRNRQLSLTLHGPRS
jgi:hypothetical protein